jgi:hypothetical protein
MLLLFQGIGSCDGAPFLSLYSHEAKDFFGFRGEWPHTEKSKQADFAGFKSLECAHISVQFAAKPPPEDLLPVHVGVLIGEGAVSVGQTGGITSSMSRRLLMVPPDESRHSNGAAGMFAEISWDPEQLRIQSIHVRDALNNTLASKVLPSESPLQLPLPRESLPACSIHVLATDGRHLMVKIASDPEGENGFVLQHKHYHPLALVSWDERKVVLGAQGSTGGGGRSLVGVGMGVACSVAAVVGVAGLLAAFFLWKHQKSSLVAGPTGQRGQLLAPRY